MRVVSATLQVVQLNGLFWPWMRRSSSSLKRRERGMLNIYDFVLVRNLNLDVIPGVELLITLLLRIALVEHSVSRTCSASISVLVSQAGQR